MEKVEQHKMKIGGFEFVLEKSTFATSANDWAA